MANHTISVSADIEKALGKKATDDGTTVAKLLQYQVEYYLACALHKHLDPNHPINTPNLSIRDRLEVFAEGVNNGEDAARAMVTAKRER